MIGSVLEFLSDILLGAGALAAAFYCVVLSRKLNRLTGLDQELGGAIALLSQQVDEMTGVLEAAQNSASGARDELTELTNRAEEVAAQLRSVGDQASVSPAPHAAADMQVAEEDAGGLQHGSASLFVRHAQGGAR